MLLLSISHHHMVERAGGIKPTATRPFPFYP